MHNTAVKQVTLDIVRASLDRDEPQWFFYDGELYLHADVLDEDFWNKLYNHEIDIGYGDKMLAELTIEQEFYEDVYGDTIMTEHTSVTRVIKYIPNKQINLNLNLFDD